MVFGSTFNYIWLKKWPAGFDMYMFAVAVSLHSHLPLPATTNLMQRLGYSLVKAWVVSSRLY
jgi:hypothetical protein